MRVEVMKKIIGSGSDQTAAECENVRMWECEMPGNDNTAAITLPIFHPGTWQGVLKSDSIPSTDPCQSVCNEHLQIFTLLVSLKSSVCVSDIFFLKMD